MGIPSSGFGAGTFLTSVRMISARFLWLLCLCLLAPSLSFTVQENLIKLEWENWKAKFGRTYGNGENGALSQEEIFRMKIWMDKKAKIEHHNRLYKEGKTSYYMGLNQFSDKLDSELAEMLTLSVPDNVNVTKSNIHRRKKGAYVPKSLDYRDQGVVGPVKNQNPCGFCWAFAGVAAVESAWALAGNGLLSLSEQEVVDCTDNNATPENCNNGGGTADTVFDFIKDYGVEEEDEYPYKGKKHSSCRAGDPDAKISNAKSLYKENYDNDVEYIEDLEDALYNHGPMFYSLKKMPTSFFKYEGGIIFGMHGECEDGPFDGGHAITLIGYGAESTYSPNDTPYWIIKNSWGTTWGDSGFAKIGKYGCLPRYAAYPVV